MIYRIDIDRFGRFFSVPCSIVDKYMRLADGSFIKVLLCVLASETPEVDSARLAEQSGLKESVVCDAMLFWTELGVLHTNGQPSCEPVPVPTNEVKPEPSPQRDQVQKRSLKYSPKDLANKVNENAELKHIISEFEQIKGNPIKDNEIVGIINLTEYYGFDAQSLMLIIEYCHALGKDSMGYIEKVAEDWFAKGITDYSEVEAEIIRQSQLRSYESKAARAFGLTGKLGKTQIEHFNKWQEMGFSIEMLEIAFDKCMEKKNELNFRYIDGILKDWAGKSIRTPEQVEQSDNAYAKKNKPKYGQKETSYDLNEWETFADNFLDSLAKRGTHNE